MERRLIQLACVVLTLGIATPALSHDCRVRGNANLRGHYEGECDKSELAHGEGEAKGVDSYVGSFVKGRPDGRGVYTWENGAKLEGSFKDGKAQGAGIYTSAKGVRYEGQFANGTLAGLKEGDCPSTPGPLSC